jgi:uncharacterized hydrophobic protein (TIGR00271 family)
MDASSNTPGQAGMNVRLLKVIQYFKIGHEVEDHDFIHEVIEKDVIFRGTNLWILVFAIIVASVGLNMNSTAVIIGAMLISPLMGPINGMGYSIATYNFDLLRKSVKNFSFAVGASLVASTLYFLISPVSAAHSELLARTSPTIYDVLIALFGGLAGIVAISSKKKGNVIPGVAIATALMPPLCTAGYGLATAQFTFFFGAIYLFTINTVFIAISAMLVSQVLKFPIRTIIEDGQRKRVNRWITIVISVTVIPSIYFGYVLVQKERFTENVTRYTRNISVFEGSYLLNHEMDPSKEQVMLTFGGNALTSESKATIRAKAADFGLHNAEIKIKQGFAFGETDPSNNEILSLKTEIDRLSRLIKETEAARDSIVDRPLIGRELLNEIRNLFPSITGCTYADTYVFSSEVSKEIPVAQVVFTVKGSTLENEDKERVRSWLKTRIKNQDIKVYYIHETPIQSVPQ